MQCQVCGKQIGPFRRLWDRKFCCDRHKKAAQRLSARALRDEPDYDTLEEPWLITAGLGDERKKSSGSGVGPAAGILLVVFLIFVVLVVPPGKKTGPAPRPQPSKLNIPNQIKKMLPGAPTVDFTEDFRSGFQDWVGSVGNSSAGWARRAGKVELGRLRLWKPTLSMANYQMVFQGEIETKAMGWAFRAADLENYYATKIAVPGPGGPPRPEIIRYVVVNGQKVDRVELPLPISVEANTPYKVRVLVKENGFSTTINGQVVDRWKDPRHSKGGIGFFSEPGERALVSWVRVNNAEGFLSRLFSFSLWVGPSELMIGPPGQY
jgi:hypothetical protein